MYSRLIIQPTRPSFKVCSLIFPAKHHFSSVAHLRHSHGDQPCNHSHSHAKKSGGHGHGHSHAEFPEMDEMDLNGDPFEFTLNEKKPTLWNKTKDFFDPHVPISQVMGSGTAHSHSHSSGHSHSHTSDPEAMKLYDTKNLANEGVKITWIGLGVNATMAVSKFAGGIYFHSQALVADAVHAVGDLFSDVLTLSTVKYSSKQANETYPLGFGKIETLGSFFVSAILLYAGFQIGWSSFIDIITPVLPHNVLDILASVPAHSHSHTHTPSIADSEVANGLETADINAAWLALGSIAVKEWLFQATRKVGEKLNSKVLIANAWHHRVDSLTSVVAVATISSGYFLNIYWLDSIGGLLVSLLVMRVGISGVVQSFKELIDKALPKDDTRYTALEDSINLSLMKADSNVLIKELAVLPSGTNMNVILKLGVGSYNMDYETNLTLDKMGQISEDIKKQLLHNHSNLKTISVQFVSNAQPEEIVPDEQKENK